MLHGPCGRSRTARWTVPPIARPVPRTPGGVWHRILQLRCGDMVFGSRRLEFPHPTITPECGECGEYCQQRCTAGGEWFPRGTSAWMHRDGSADPRPCTRAAHVTDGGLTPHPSARQASPMTLYVEGVIIEGSGDRKDWTQQGESDLGPRARGGASRAESSPLPARTGA
jgi:hypothetical protein